MGTKILFLDIDGVLNRRYTRERASNGVIGIDTELVSIFKRILSETDTKIVLSSTWRLYPELLPYVWTCLGEDAKTRCIDKTPHSFSGHRGHEIKYWFEQHPDIEVDKFVILDDDNDMEPYMDHLIQTDGREGITNEIANQVINTLQ